MEAGGIAYLLWIFDEQEICEQVLAASINHFRHEQTTKRMPIVL